MRNAHIGSVGRGVLVAIALAAAAPSPAFAQTWLAPKGEASFSFSYTNIWVHDHLFNDGTPVDRGRVYSQDLVSDLGYSVTDRLAVSIGLPFVAARYEGTRPHKPVGRPSLDDGSYHGTFQDLRIEARCMATKGSLVLTPFVRISLPSHHYEHFAHVAVGKDLKEIQAGFNIGRRLDPVLPEAYVQGRYGFAVPERVLGIWHNRSNADLELGYFVTSALTVRALGMWQVTHGGFREPVDSTRTPENLDHHDQLARANFFEVGAGASYALTRSLDGYVSWFETVSGRNGHKFAGAVSVGLSVNFSPAQVMRKMQHRAEPDAAPEQP